MSRPRYEPIPQNTDEEVINLHTIIPQPPSYNYNSGIPNSPPPSFRSSQSVQSVQLQPDRSANATPVPSFPTPNPNDPANPTNSQIQDLHFRIERLEESVGRLLLEKEALLTDGQSDGRKDRNNCCVIFSTDDDAEAMRSMIMGSSSNCCVRYEGRNKGDAKRKRIEAIGLVFGILFLLMGVFTIVVMSIDARRSENKPRS